MTDFTKLKDEELESVTGGVVQGYENGVLRNVLIGDIVTISGYISGFDGTYCLVRIFESGSYKLTKYEKGKVMQNAITLHQFSGNVIVNIIGHDDEFVELNA